MDSSDTTFTTLLERYVLSIAGQIVDQVDRRGQDRLIRLLLRIDTVSEPAASAVVSTEDLLLALWPPIPFTRTNEPPQTERKGPHNEERRRLLTGLIAGHQTTIDATLGYLMRVDLLLARAEKRASPSLRQASLLARYQSLRQGYLTVLVKIRALQAGEQIKLNRYQ